MSTNPRACTNRVWVDIELECDDHGHTASLQVTCLRLGCAWPTIRWDRVTAGPMSVDDLLKFQETHDQWVEEGAA